MAFETASMRSPALPAACSGMPHPHLTCVCEVCAQEQRSANFDDERLLDAAGQHAKCSMAAGDSRSSQQERGERCASDLAVHHGQRLEAARPSWAALDVVWRQIMATSAARWMHSAPGLSWGPFGTLVDVCRCIFSAFCKSDTSQTTPAWTAPAVG